MEADAAAAGKPVKHPLRPRSEYMDQVSQHRVLCCCCLSQAALQAPHFTCFHESSTLAHAPL